MKIRFNNTYIKLPQNFYSKVLPVPVKDPKLGCFNFALAEQLGIQLKSSNPQEIAEIFSGNKILAGSEPIALAYAGHQFGHFVDELGDGRAILLGEVLNRQGLRRDIQLKGSGITPYSRRGDGRASLGPMIREYIVSEAMHALGIKTTRALAVITTGESVYRETTLPGAILTRVASSHIRIGTFEYFASQGDLTSLKILADYVIERHYLEAKKSSNPYLSLFTQIRDNQVSLIADWIRVGFIHGVMNTDNTALSGETIDYGPCAFIDEYHPNKVFSSIDYYGRYAFYNQSHICLWNLWQLGKCLAFLVDNTDPRKGLDAINDKLYAFDEIYESAYLEIMRKKIGVIYSKQEDKILIQTLLNIMQDEALDYTLTFRYLTQLIKGGRWALHKIFNPPLALETWLETWRNRLKEQNCSNEAVYSLMAKSNPSIIPRNHKLDEIIQYTEETNDFSKMITFLGILSDPYNEKGSDLIEYIRPPTSKERIHKTFCGT